MNTKKEKVNNEPIVQSQFFSTRFFYFVISLLLIARVVEAIIVPVINISEARYAEIARKLIETNDWVTLYHDYGVPFWAKPPLSSWISALGALLFGMNEFALRAPILLISIILMYLIFHVAKTQYKKNTPEISVLVLFSSAGFYFFSATIFTDMVFTFGITLSMVSFWLTIKEQIFWKYLFFVGIAISLLAKGIIALPLIGFPLLLWIILKKNLKETWQIFPWIKGSILTISIAAPWYILAELKTPGFLKYFIIGEHFSRFLISGWEGDLYGHAHDHNIGTIWIYWIFLALPWSIWFIVILIKNFLNKSNNINKPNDFVLYFSLWFISPLVFFTFCRNIIPSYPLPAIPAFALLMGSLISRNSTNLRAIFFSMVFFIPFITLGIVTYYQFTPFCESQKDLIYNIMKTHPNAHMIYLREKVPYDGKFYSNGRAKNAKKERIEELLDHKDKIFIIGTASEMVILNNIMHRFKETNRHCSMILLESIE